MNEERHISCPICQRYIMKSGGCKDTALSCSKCGTELLISVDSSSVNIRVIRMSPKQKKTA